MRLLCLCFSLLTLSCFGQSFTFRDQAFLGAVQPVTAAAFSPTNVSGIYGWLKADALSLNDADPVGTWTASFGTNALQATAGNKPLYKANIQNGKPVVRFDGSDDFMQVDCPAPHALDQPFTYFLVFKMFTTAGTKVWIDSKNCVSVHYYLETSSNLRKFYAGSSEESTGSADTSWHIIMIEANGASSKYRVDGGTDTTFGASPGTSYYAGFTLGAYYDGTILHSQVDIGELIFYAGTLASGDKTSIFNYLNTRWAVY